MNDVARPRYSDPLFDWQPQPSCAPAAAPPKPPCSGPVPDVAQASGLHPAPDLPAEFTMIWSVLECHRGAAAAITAPQIAAAAGLWPDMADANRGTKVRKILEITQDYWPWPICGDTDGYYLAATAEELSHYCANLRSRAICVLRRFASFRRCGLRSGFVHLGHGRWAEPQPKGGPSIAKLSK